MSAVSFRLAAVVLALCSGLAAAQNPADPKPAGAYVPQSGQEGKDVVWVPTPQVVVDKMLEVAKVGPKDLVMDLGSGDGRTVITAAKLGARAMGIEYNPDMVEYAKRNAEKAGVAARASFVKADLFKTDFSKASVITMFLLTDINMKLRPRLLKLRPGTRIVSNTFTMGEWEPDVKVDLSGDPGCGSSYCTVLHWVVPRQVGGTYKVAQGEVTLKQSFQMLSGEIQGADGAAVAVQGRVRGETIELAGGGRKYVGRLKGKALELREAGA
ncbi:MAG: class I SAM-dependent methyltransferase [Burkholderiales bacterium]|nr:class I SAM-dependent methyltransferase [Burkholderiales bacterium]